MPSMAWPWIAFAVIVLSFLLQTWQRKNKHRKMPPSPRGIPILGHLHLLGKNPHQELHKLAQNCGPIMYLRFGFVPVIVVSSPHTAEQILRTHDLVFASRPPQEAAKYISYDQRNMSFSKYGSYWRDIRKLITLELLSSLRIKSFQPMRKEELELFVKSLKQAAKDCIPVDLSAKVASVNADMSCLMIFGKKYKDDEFDEKGFKAVIKEGMQLAALPNLGNYFPYIGKLDLQGLNRRMKAVANVFDGFFEKIIDEHDESKEQGKTKDFVDTLLAIMNSGGADFQMERAHIKANMLDLLAASMDTSATAIDWLMSELIKHPRVMKKVQKELERVVGKKRMVDEADLEKLEYLDMVVKESFRLHPVAPLLLPHEAMEECTIDGYHIPEKSHVMVNVWAIGRDPNVWGDDPEKFFPERFVGSKIDLRGRDFQLIPFGSGRRGCPGMQLGLQVVRLVVAQLVHCFDWELPNNSSPEDLDMTEEFGLVVTRANHLLAIPTYRLNDH